MLTLDIIGQFFQQQQIEQKFKFKRATYYFDIDELVKMLYVSVSIKHVIKLELKPIIEKSKLRHSVEK